MDARANLQSRLGDGVRWVPARMVVDRERPELLTLLRRMVFVDVEGLQVGDHNRQTDTFTYAATRSPSGASLLRENRDLAVALAKYVCPCSVDGHAACFSTSV